MQPFVVVLNFQKTTKNYVVYSPKPEDGVGSLYLPPSKFNGSEPPQQLAVECKEVQ